jgi:hypothetical protein
MSSASSDEDVWFGEDVPNITDIPGQTGERGALKVALIMTRAVDKLAVDQLGL